VNLLSVPVMLWYVSLRLSAKRENLSFFFSLFLSFSRRTHTHTHTTQVQKAYQLWLQYEVRTDDITVIVVKLDGLHEASKDERSQEKRRKTAHEKTNVIITSQRDAKRRKTRKKIASNPQLQNLATFYPEEHKVPKGKEERERIRKAVKENFLFSKLNSEQLELTIDVMKRQQVKLGEILIREGDEGDKFYIAEKGTYDVIVKDKKVHEYNAKNNLFPSFGELALLHGAPRKATIKATSDGSLWVLERLAFQTMLMLSPEQALLKQLQKIKTFKCVPLVTLRNMCDNMEIKSYKEGDAICRQGELAHHFYVVKTGRVAIERDGRQLQVGQRYFGERALITSDPRKATVVARGDTTCYVMARDMFEEKFGKMQTFIDIYNRQKKHNEELAKLLNDYTENFGNGLRVFGKTHDERKLFSDFNMDPESKSSTEEKYVVSNDSIDGKLTIVTMNDKIYSVKSVLCLGKAALEHVKNQAKLALELSTSCKQYATTIAQREEKKVIDETTTDLWMHTLMEGEICASLHELFHDEHHVFTEKETRYVIASMISALSTAHLHNIIYRSIAPEFISLDKQGRVKLHHLELAKQTKFMEHTRTRCGMPEFMAPEQILGSGHGTAVDLWGLGVLTYDLLCGCTPFAPNHESELMVIYENILGHTVYDTFETPKDLKVNPLALDFISKLLHPTPAKRLGSTLEVLNESKSLMNHKWFDRFDWKALESGTMPSQIRDLVDKKPSVGKEDEDEGFEI